MGLTIKGPPFWRVFPSIFPMISLSIEGLQPGIIWGGPSCSHNFSLENPFRFSLGLEMVQFFWAGKMTSVSSHLQWRLQPHQMESHFLGRNLQVLSHRIPWDWYIHLFYLHLKPWKSTIHGGKQTSPMDPMGITQFSSRHSFLAGGNSNIFGIFTPDPWENFPILTSIFFQMGWFNHQLVVVLFADIYFWWGCHSSLIIWEGLET